MESGIYGYILRHSRRDQITLILLSLAALPSLYYSFELPKLIVNEALSATSGFPKQWWGLELERVSYLFTLCGIFLALVLINAAFKFFTSTYRYRVGDRLLRRLRYELVERLLRFPVGEFRNQSSGRVVSMVAAETSPLGFFMSEAFTVPTVAAGTLFTVLLFIFMQDWVMGFAALALYPVQIYLVPKIQQRVNDLQRRESLAIRGVSDNVSQIISNATEIHGHDTSQFELARVTRRLQTIFDLRVKIATSRYTVNVLNQFFSQLTPFFFLSIGGYLVIQGDITLGSLVAVLAAHKDMYSPWKDLIDYYQKAEDARVKYGQLRDYFTPPHLMDVELIAADPPPIRLSEAPLILFNVVVEGGDGLKPIDGVNLRLTLPTHAAFIGGTATTRAEIARLLLRQSRPSSGEVKLGVDSILDLPDSVIGLRLAYAGPDARLAGGALREVMTYPLLRRPVDKQPFLGAEEAALTGNSTLNPDADWLDYAAAGCRNREELDAWLLDVLRLTGLEVDVYDWGIRRTLHELSAADAVRILDARAVLLGRLRSSHLAEAVEPFDPVRFLEGSSLAENIIFGTVAKRADHDTLLRLDRYLLDTLRTSDLVSPLARAGQTVATLMIEMFRNLDPADEFFQGFNLIEGDELAAYELLIRKVGNSNLDALDDDGKVQLVRLALKLVAMRHTLGVIDDTLRQGVLRARKKFRLQLPADLQAAVVFFEEDAVNPAGNLYDNLLFGKTLSARSETQSGIAAMVRETIETAGMLPFVLRLGLEFDVGLDGAFLSVSQRQRVALARCLIKRPDVLVLNDAFAAIEPHRQTPIITAVRDHIRGRSLLLIEGSEINATGMEHVFDVTNGRLQHRATAQGRPAVGADQRFDAVDLGGTAEVLSKVPLFAGIDRARLKLLAFTSERVTCASGDIVFRQGDAGDKAYVVLDGQVEVIVESPAGDTVVATIGRHQIFGEMALLASRPRTTTIRAGSPTQLLALRQDVFVRLVKEDAGIALGITRVLIDRLANTLKGVKPQ